MKKAGIVLLGAFAALAIGATSAFAGDPLVVIHAAKHKHGDYDHNQGLTVPVGAEKTAYWRVKNVSDSTKLELRLDDGYVDGQNPDGWKLQWFKGDQNISSDVKADGFEFNLKAGAKKYFTTTVKHKAVGETDFCLPGHVFGLITDPDYAYFGVNGPCV